MGCGVSSHAVLEDLPFRKPRINIRIGDRVRHIDPDINPKIIFIFGGPGSRKGRIVDELVNTFGFTLLSAEALILENLPNKIDNITSSSSLQNMNTTQAMQRVLKDNPELLTLEWGLHLIENAIKSNGFDSLYLVDIIPNLRYLLTDNLFGKDCTSDMENFEDMFPCLFAVNITCPEIKRSKKDSQPSEAFNEYQGSEGQSDEMDLTRTQKRRARYELCVQYFLEYFIDSGRMVTIDGSSDCTDLIWQRLYEFLDDLHTFTPSKTVDTVIVFCFSFDEISGLDVQRYGLARINMKSAVGEPVETFEDALEWLCREIDKKPASAKYYLVEAEGSPLLQQYIPNGNQNGAIKVDSSNCFKELQFMEIEEVRLDKFISVAPRQKLRKNVNRKTSLFQKKFKAVSSLESEIYLFPLNTDIELCKLIVGKMDEHRKTKAL